MTDPNWVEARAKCTIQNSFELIVNQIEIDIGRFNKLKQQSDRPDGRFIVIHKEHSGFAKVIKAHIEVQGSKEFLKADDINPQDCITVEIKDSEIYAEVNTGKPTDFNLNIKRKWNPETLTCDLIVNDKPTQPWNISETILEPFIFEQAE